MVSVEILNDVETFVIPLDINSLGEYAADVLARSGKSAGSINIVFVDDSHMTELNEQYKKGSGTTDVLTFNLSESVDKLEGEIYISPGRAEAQAQEFEVTFEEELVRLTTHGLLHLAGYIHDDDDAYRKMMTLTDSLVAEFFSEGE